jgi:hypothetical protein
VLVDDAWKRVDDLPALQGNRWLVNVCSRPPSALSAIN